MPCRPLHVQLTEALLAAAPPDDHVLNMLLLVLKPANRVRDLAAAYEAAVAKQPGNEDLLHGLFACHARCVRACVCAWCALCCSLLPVYCRSPSLLSPPCHLFECLNSLQGLPVKVLNVLEGFLEVLAR